MPHVPPSEHADAFAAELEVLITDPFGEPLGRRPTEPELRSLARHRPWDLRNFDDPFHTISLSDVSSPWPEPMALERLLLRSLGGHTKVGVRWGVVATFGAVALMAQFLSPMATLLTGTIILVASWILVARSPAAAAYEPLRQEWIRVWGHHNTEPPDAETTIVRLIGRLEHLVELVPARRAAISPVTAALTHRPITPAELTAAIRLYAGVRAERLIGCPVTDIAERISSAPT